VDNKGLGKPQMFSNREDDFRVWHRKVSNFICSQYREVREILKYCEVQDAVIDLDDLALQFDGISEEIIKELNDRVHECLMSLTDGESNDLVYNAGEGQGFDAWRLLQKRWDPSTVGRAKKIFREIGNPGRVKSVAELPAAIEKLNPQRTPPGSNGH